MPKRKLRLPTWLIVVLGVVGVLLLLFLLACLLCLSPLGSKAETVRVNIDKDDTADSVYYKLQVAASPNCLLGFRLMSALSGYTHNIRSGSYLIEPRQSSLDVLRKLRSRRQDPVRIRVPEVRTKADLATRLSAGLMMEPQELLSILNDSATCAAYGLDLANIIGLFIPNTYEVYWDLSPRELMGRMERESQAFWTPQRLARADSIGLSPAEVITLASIVDEETANNAEKPMIAGMYINRLRIGMPLQADPTIKFALQDFTLRRIYHKHLSVESPYNTYLHAGLPPGPIRIPSIVGIDAVLGAVHHTYLYMCAKEDFSGTHNFAATYEEHLRNARRYSQALNKRGIN